jgi:uncharacterized damage-inducible protein DinB
MPGTSPSRSPSPWWGAWGGHQHRVKSAQRRGTDAQPDAGRLVQLEKGLMDANYFRFLYDHMCWARDKILAAAGGLSEEEYTRDAGWTYKSIHGILAHTLGGETVWFPRLRGEQPSMTRPEDVPTREALKAKWAEEESKHRAYLDELTDADIAADMVFTGRDGQERRIPRWQILTLVYHHTTQHRSEAAEALSMLGHSPGDFDLLVFTRERGQ